MYEINRDIQTGYPQLDKDYWKKNNQEEQNQPAIIRENMNNALKDISIFK
jgi:hypothetical protein